MLFWRTGVFLSGRMNIRYEDGELFCVTGTSVNFFTLDKSLETEWDEAVKGFLKEHQIPYLCD